MRGTCKVFLVGRVGKDPDWKSGKSGVGKTQFSVVVNGSYKDSDGQWVEDPQWYNVTILGRAAESAAQNVRRGMAIYVTGEWRNEEYEKDGEQKRWTYLKSFEFQLLESKKDREKYGSDDDEEWDEDEDEGYDEEVEDDEEEDEDEVPWDDEDEEEVEEDEWDEDEEEWDDEEEEDEEEWDDEEEEEEEPVKPLVKRGRPKKK